MLTLFVLQYNKSARDVARNDQIVTLLYRTECSIYSNIITNCVDELIPDLSDIVAAYCVE